MLAPRASSAFVCIRCELQLARPRLSTLARRTSHASFSASSRSRDEEQSTDAQIAELQVPTSHRTLERIRKRKGRTVKQTTARLGGIKTLGADAEILVLEEVADATSEQPEAAVTVLDEASQPQSASQILASLQQDKEVLTTAEIQEQIHSLRPKTAADPDGRYYITQSAFVKLGKVLTRAFNASQLSQYYSVSRGPHENAEKVLGGLATQGPRGRRLVRQRTDWHAGTTQINMRLPALNSKSKPIRKPINKKILVDQILRHVWKLVLLEEMENPGEIEITLKPWQLLLLNTGDNGSDLDAVGRFRMAKIEIHWPDNVVRITADKSTAEYAANDIEQLVQNYESRKFNITPWLPYLAEDRVKDKKLNSIFSKADVKMVASLSRTAIQVVSDDKLLIRGLNKGSTDQAEIALRRLLPLKQPETRTIDTERLVEARESSFLVPTGSTKTLDRDVRYSRFGRWILPTKRSSEAESVHEGTPIAEDETEIKMQNRALTILRESLKQSLDRQPTDLDNTIGHWTIKPLHKISANFGQVIFPLEEGPPEQAIKTAVSRNFNHPFWHEFPGFFKLLTSGRFIAINHTRSAILEYKFVAAPEQEDFDVGQTFPSLYIHFKHDADGKPALHRLSLGFGESRIHDVLLPGKVSDIRFNQYSRLTMNEPALDPSVREFIEAVSANINSGARLSAPSLRLQIPAWTIPGITALDNETRPVTYLFTGAVVRQSLIANSGTFRLSYATVESGELGRSGSMLTAYYSPAKQQNGLLPDEEQGIAQFVRQSFGFVDEISHAAQGTQRIADRAKKQRHEMSERRLRRQVLHEATAKNEGSVEGERGVSEIAYALATTALQSTDNTLVGDDVVVTTPKAEEDAQDQDQDQRNAAPGDAEPTMTQYTNAKV